MDAKALLSSLLLLPMTGCAVLDHTGAARSGDIDASLHDAVVAELLGDLPDEPHAGSNGFAPGPSLIAGDMIALAWLTAHTESIAPEQRRLADSVIPTFDSAPESPNLALWTPAAWETLGYE